MAIHNADVAAQFNRMADLLEIEGANPFRLGDKVRLVPSHCDTTVNLHDRYIGVRGERIETQWPVAARGMSQ